MQEIHLFFRSCTLLQHKRNVTLGTVRKIFNATSDLQSFVIAILKILDIESVYN